MAADRQHMRELRVTALVPEAIIPQPSTRRIPWGPLLVAPLLAGTAGLGLAWSLGLGDLREAEPIVRTTAATPASRAPRSPYPADLTDLTSQPALPTMPPTFAPAAPLTSVAESTPVPPPRASSVPSPSPQAMPAPRGTERSKSARLSTAVAVPHVAPVARPGPVAPTLPPSPMLAKPVPPRSAQPLGGPLAALFVPSDYPATARRDGERGDVTVRLTVRSDGRPNECRILAADASPALKAATCAILMRRAHFIPASDTSGAATEGSFVQHVAWRLP